MTSHPKWTTFYGNKIVRGKTKKTGKPKVYNLYTQLRASLRQVWLRSPAKQAAERLARQDRGQYLCEICKQIFGPKEIRVDHKDPVVSPEEGFKGWDSYIDRLFCGPEGLQVLCKPCHLEKTKEERARRKRACGDYQGELLDL